MWVGHFSQTSPKGKDYAGKYALSGKRITLIGISFSSEKRTIVEELVEIVSG